jgi:hypothetical protein
MTQLLASGLRISTFGEDEAGEVYVAHHSATGGAVYRVYGRPPFATPTPGTLALPDTPVGEKSPLVPVTVTNEGPDPVTVGSIRLGGLNPDQFRTPPGADGCTGRTLAAAESCALSVRLKPDTSGIKHAVLTIPSTDPGATPATVTLRGTATP